MDQLHLRSHSYSHPPRCFGRKHSNSNFPPSFKTQWFPWGLHGSKYGPCDSVKVYSQNLESVEQMDRLLARFAIQFWYRSCFAISMYLFSGPGFLQRNYSALLYLCYPIVIIVDWTTRKQIQTQSLCGFGVRDANENNPIDVYIELWIYG